MTTHIYTTELREINEKFNLLETDVEAKLNYSVPDAKARQAIRSEVNLLKIQITDPRNKGIGTEARQIINRIERIIGKKITPLTPINQTQSGYEDLANRMEEQIIGMVYNLSPEEKTMMNEINNAVLKWNNDIQKTLLLTPNQINDIAQGQVDHALNDYNRLGARAQQNLGEGKFRFEPMHSNTQEVGKIGYAFSHAIENFGMFQFVVLAGCILLDYGILLIILLMPSDPSNRNSTNSGSVFNNKRSGKTLIPNN